MTLFLRVNVARGMFPTEFAVSFMTSQAQELSLFVPVGMVRDVEGEPLSDKNGAAGKIPVQLVSEDSDSRVVALPFSSIEGPRVARVSAASVAVA